MRWLATAGIAALVLAASGATADTFAIRLVSQTSNTITLGWDPQPGYGYLFSADGQVVSRTNDPGRDTVKFSTQYSAFDIDVIVKGANGHYPLATPPPPATAKITQTIAAGSTITSLVDWRATYDANNDGTEDDPGSVEFLIDGTRVLSEENAPFGDSFADGSYTVANGSHVFKVRALNGTTVLAENSVTATVDATVPPPPPPPPTGFPGATNTGVPAGTVLTAYTGPSTITTANTVIDSKTTGCLTIQALGVVIRNSRITCGGGWATSAWNSVSSMTIQDSEIVCGPSEGSTGVVGDHITLTRVNIHGCENAMAADGDDTIQDSWFHDMYNGGNAHADGIQFPDGANNINIVHNTIITLGAGGTFGNLAGSINADTSSHSNWLIENNLLGGGAFTVYCVAPGKGTNWVIRNNAFMNNYGVGYSTQCGDETQSGNYKYETGAPLQLG